MYTDFRHLLRQSSQADHDALDDMISRLDLATASGFVVFARIHLHCFAAMVPAAHPGSWARDALDTMRAHLARDIAILGGDAPCQAAPDLGPVHPLALDYMVSGSRLGTKVLSKRWAGSTDPAVSRADNYFGAPVTMEAWRKTCQTLSAIDPASPEAQTITRDTNRLFQLFTETSKNFAPLLSASES